MNDISAESLSASLDRLGNSIDNLVADNNAMEQALSECLEYFEERAEAVSYPDKPSGIPNKELRLQVMIEQVLRARKR